MSMQRLRRVSQELNNRRERVALEIKRFESQILETKVGVTVWLEQPVLNDFQVGLTKIGGKWHLAARKTGSGELLPGDPMQLSHAPFKVRIEVLEHRDEIIQAIIGRAESMTESIDEKLEGLGLPGAILKDPPVKERTPRRRRRAKS